MSGSAASKADHYYWLAYCKLIKDQAGAQFGSNGAIFYCTQAQTGVVGGAMVPQEITNSGVYNLADNMLNPTDLFYVASHKNGFAKAVQTYLRYVDLGGNPEPGAAFRYAEAIKTFNASEQALATALDKALATFNKQKSAGIIGPGMDFNNWAVQNAPGYQQANQDLQAAAAQMTQLADEVYGPLASQWNVDLNKLNSAIYGQTPMVGLNMGCSDTDPITAADYLSKIKLNQPIPPATGIYYRPLYSIPNYGPTIDDWIRNYANRRKNPPGSASITLDVGKNVSLSEFGYQRDEASIGWGWFISFGGSAVSEEQRESLNVSKEGYTATITMFWNGMKTLPINPGNWNIGDPKAIYPKLRSDAPPEAAKLVRPTQVLCASGVGLKVSFGGGLETEFDSKVNKYEKIEGGVRIFGFNISGSHVSTSAETTHVGTWDRASSTYTVHPTDNAGFCTLLAVIGEKLSA